MSRQDVSRIRAEVRERIESVGALPDLYNVEGIAAEFRSLHGDRTPVKSMYPPEFWDLAARHRRTVS